MLKLVFLCWTLLSASSVPVAYGSLLDTVPKCCGDYELLDVKNQSCEFAKQNTYNVTTGSENQNYHPANSFPLRCPNGFAIFNVTSDALVSDSVTVPGGNRTLSNGEMCIANSASNVTTIAYCKAINKCCPLGQVLHSSLKKCVTAQDAATFDRIVREDGTQLPFVHDASGLKYYVNFCVFQMSNSSDGIEVNDYNETIVTDTFFSNKRNISFFCLDTVERSANGHNKMLAMVGNPVKQQNFYANIRKFFPHFCFVSSAFLFLTSIYYCAMPKLRKNVHGFSMICFLFSMMIVQIDLGIAFSIARRTCVCAFIPYHRNFFRYSSTAWTTVVGYIIWKQLRNVNIRSNHQESKILTFALYSLYAWGLPLVITLSSIIYEHFYPFTKACWWTSQHVKMFMDIPNIILQLFNNIFFIPSAMHVCKSLKFLNDAVANDTNALRNKRRMAVVKMFAMMQSTKLAEILFCIRSLFDIQSDVYFMFTMCLYTIIGPILFFVLVDISAVFRQCHLKVLGEGFQWRFRHSPSVTSIFRPTESFSLDPSSDGSTGNSSSSVQPVRYLKKQDSTASTFSEPTESAFKEDLCRAT